MHVYAQAGVVGGHPPAANTHCLAHSNPSAGPASWYMCVDMCIDMKEIGMHGPVMCTSISATRNIYTFIQTSNRNIGESLGNALPGLVPALF